jgi:hypothetical protein
MNIICAKWGTKYSAEHVNKLFAMVSKNSCGQDFDFYCYTDDTAGLSPKIKTVKIESNLEGFWPKLDVLKLFNEGENIFFDLDVVILNPLYRLFSVKTRTFSVLYSQWKEGFLTPSPAEKYDTLYCSDIMKWQDKQGHEVYDYFDKNKDMIMLKYKGMDRYFFHEPVQVDLLPTGIAYSYWKGARYLKDTTPEKLRKDYEVCIFNEGSKQETAQPWVKDYWIL